MPQNTRKSDLSNPAMNIPEINLKRVVIIGGGFAGLNIAKNLSGKDFQIVMLDKHNYHTFQPLLYQVATAGLEPDSIAHAIRQIFTKKVNFYFRIADVKEIDPSTMKSKIIDNLSFAGEVIDVDAVTGGYNLQIAFSTGFLAGSSL